MLNSVRGPGVPSIQLPSLGSSLYRSFPCHCCSALCFSSSSLPSRISIRGHELGTIASGQSFTMCFGKFVRLFYCAGPIYGCFTFPRLRSCNTARWWHIFVPAVFKSDDTSNDNFLRSTKRRNYDWHFEANVGNRVVATTSQRPAHGSSCRVALLNSRL